MKTGPLYKLFYQVRLSLSSIKHFQNGDQHKAARSEGFMVLENINKIIASTKATTTDTTKKSGNTVAALLKKDTLTPPKSKANALVKKDTTATPKSNLSLLSKVQKTAGKDTSAALGKDKLAQQNPLFSILQPAMCTRIKSGQQRFNARPYSWLCRHEKRYR